MSSKCRRGFDFNLSTSLTHIGPAYIGCLLLALLFTAPISEAAEPLPRVVLLGDSIRLSYAPTVIRQLQGEATVFSPVANGGDSANLRRHLEEWVIRQKPDVVHFNCGIHDTKKFVADSRFQVTPEDYEANLRAIVTTIRDRTDAVVLFALSTPILNDRAAQARRDRDYVLLGESIDLYNQIARRVMAELKVPVSDLHTSVSEPAPPHSRESLLGRDGVHLTPVAQQFLGQQTAEFIRSALPAQYGDGPQGDGLVSLPSAAPEPDDNRSTPATVELGKLLFFDPRLSGDNQMSCATCHMPEKAYGDGLALSPGAGGRLLERHTQTCLNVAFLPVLFWDGRAGSLEEQSVGPIASTAEMNQDLTRLEAELADVEAYRERFQSAFGRTPHRDDIGKALAAFQRTLVTGPSPLDRYLAGDEQALSADAKAGLELFRGEAGCIECHRGPLLSDGKFYRLGIAFEDEGRALVTGRRDDRFRFRTPSLRNVAETGPYMHNGSLKTLDDVVTFYYRGIPESGPDGLNPDTAALSGRSFSEIPLLVAFLKSLSGPLPTVERPVLP